MTTTLTLTAVSERTSRRLAGCSELWVCTSVPIRGWAQFVCVCECVSVGEAALGPYQYEGKEWERVRIRVDETLRAGVREWQREYKRVTGERAGEEARLGFKQASYWFWGGGGDTVSASTEDYSNLAFWYCCCSGNDTNPTIFIKKISIRK